MLLRFKKHFIISQYITSYRFRYIDSLKYSIKFYERTHNLRCVLRSNYQHGSRAYAGRQNNQLRVALCERWNRGWLNVAAIALSERGEEERESRKGTPVGDVTGGCHCEGTKTPTPTSIIVPRLKTDRAPLSSNSLRSPIDKGTITPRG